MIFRPSRDNVSSVLEIDNWVMSCRVFGRQLEREVMNIAVQAARERGIESLCADFIPTQRNGVISNLFADLGFVRLSRADGALAASRVGPGPRRLLSSENAYHAKGYISV